jgi:peptidoglycan/LPS O-acetylase OafA/YrhL
MGWCGSLLRTIGLLGSGLLFAGYQERGRLEVSRFYIRRGLKIWPAFYTLIAAGLLIEAVRGRCLLTRGLLVELLFMQSYFRGIWHITWSLAVEEHFYLTLPLLLLLMTRRKTERPFEGIPYVFGAAAAFALACRLVVGWDAGRNDFATFLFPTHLRIDGLMFGVLLSYYHRYQHATFERLATWRGGWLLIGAVVALLSTFPVEDRNMHTWGLTVVYLGAGCLVAKAVSFEGPGAIQLVSRLLAQVGVYSYSIYLWHTLFSRMLQHLEIRSQTLGFWCYFVGANLFGIAAAKTIEMPALRFRDRLFPRAGTSPLLSLNRPAAKKS